jgi:uncharacterized membrane protein
LFMQPTTAANPLAKSPRIASIDLLRGLIMVIMALDHVRDYFHAEAFKYDPLDLQKTSVVLFLTRWITHYCAPTFMFLAGVSAFLIGLRKSKKELSGFLFKRGLWLVFLEFTVVHFAWKFNPAPVDFLLIVIWALGISMIVLAALIWLPRKALLIFGLLLALGHNALDNVHVAGQGIPAFLWAVLHEQHPFFFHGVLIVTVYPMVPWIGVMALGYVFGSLYAPSFPAAQRKKMLTRLGLGMTLLFVLLRWSNVYGDPSPWSQQSSTVFTLLSFLKTTKYPPSLLYLLMTLGPSILFLAVSENAGGWLSRKLSVYGRVPMFYYILHIYWLHLLALLAAPLCGHRGSDMIIGQGWLDNQPQLKGFGFSLGVVYLVWLFVVLSLYPLCSWYDRYKREHKDKWWLRYL